MIAVEWSDWDGPRDQLTNAPVVRTGVLLQVVRGRLDGTDADVAYVITRRMPHDGFVSGHKRPDGDFPNIIKTVLVSKVIVKGVNIPFDPHGAGK